jgi:hypothetical protein
MFKRCKVDMLPTNEKAENCFIWRHKELMWEKSYFTQAYLNSIGAEARHLYILSEETPVDGDIVMVDCSTHIEGWKGKGIWKYHKAPCPIPYWGNPNCCKTIIATTNPSLVYKISRPLGVTQLLPKLSTGFLTKYAEEFNKGNIITDVLVEYTSLTDMENMLQIEKYVPEDTFQVSLKVDSKNNITIRRLKADWTKDEVTEAFKSFNMKYGIATSDELHTWIKLNLL